MKIQIITVGSPKLEYARTGFSEYVSRLKHYHDVKVTHLSDKNNDAAHFLTAISKAYTIALVIDGPQLTSPALATKIEQWNQQGREVAFLIGGPDGLPTEIINQSNMQFSFSRLTFPHDLAMLILAETLYRASTIQAGQPYHR